MQQALQQGGAAAGEGWVGSTSSLSSGNVRRRHSMEGKSAVTAGSGHSRYRTWAAVPNRGVFAAEVDACSRGRSCIPNQRRQSEGTHRLQRGHRKLGRDPRADVPPGELRVAPERLPGLGGRDDPRRLSDTNHCGTGNCVSKWNVPMNQASDRQTQGPGTRNDEIGGAGESLCLGRAGTDILCRR